MTDSILHELLAGAHTHINSMLDHLRQDLARLRNEQTAAAQQSRQLQRTLDEVSIQLSFAQELKGNRAQQLLEQEQRLREQLVAVDEQARVGMEAIKRLEQLIHQIEMSSTSLHGTAKINIADDPWSLALRGQVIHGREEERVRLAREVHDGPAQVLANVLMGLEHAMNLTQQYPQQVRDFLPELRDAAKLGLGEIRSFIADLRPGALEQGLQAALAAYVQTYNQKHDAYVTLECDQWPPTISTEAEIVIYRVVQEALQNIHKHARQAQVLIRSTYQQQVFTLVIRDNGPGFDPREVAQRTGKQSWGLTSMRERVALIGGDFAIASRRGAGTEVMLRIPL